MRVRITRASTKSTLTVPSSSSIGAGIGSGLAVGDLCPECGNSTLMFTEGCRKCYQCGHSEC